MSLPLACSTSNGGISRGRGSGSSGAGSSDGSGGSGTVQIGQPPPPDGGRAMRCDSSGHCTCINVGSFGRPAHYGSGNDNTDAFQSWLNNNSASTANVVLITTHTPLTPELLKNYDVIVLQALEDAEYGPFWSFDASEIQALSDWVNAGGGLISLMGYGGDADEVNPTNQLLAFSGISYNPDDVLTTCPSNLCYCWGNSVPITNWAAGHPVSANLTQIGGFHGRSINPGDASVISSDGTYVYAAGKSFGAGKVFVFSDEWVTYTSQWLGTGQQQTINTYDPCYDPVHDYMMTADKVFQVPQFWYNSIKWVAPPTQCDFTLTDPTIVK